MPLQIKESIRGRKKAGQDFCDNGASISDSGMYRYNHLSDDDKYLVERLLRGQIQLEELPTIRSKTVKIFISSTFTDMIEERNALAENVYPKLREYCRDKYGIDFQAVDMRWGVPVEASDDHSATDLCLAELRSCQKMSVGPNFVAFIGQRYGSCPLPSTILRAEFEIIESHVEKKDLYLITKSYLKDQNVHPNVYRLQPVSYITGTVKRDWGEIELDLRRIIMDAIQAAVDASELSKESYRKLTASVTEHEIYEGLIDIKRQKDRDNNILLYVRDIQDLHRHLKEEKVKRFIDLKDDGNVNQEVKDSLDKVRETCIEKLSSLNYSKSSISWHRDGITSKTHKTYLTRMCNHFFKTTSALVDRNIATRKKLDNDPLYHEVVQHWTLLKGRCESFVGRKDIFLQIQHYLQCNDSNHPLVIYGPSGSGKTSLLAKTVLLVESTLKYSNASVVFRFLGTTPNSSSIQQLLFSVCHQIAFIYNKDRASIPSDISSLKKYFADFVKNGDFPGVVVIILDSLDQLSPNFNGLKLDWLPARHAPNVRIIVSTLPDKHKLLEILQNKVSDNFIKIESLPPKDCENIIQVRMEAANRKVTYEQWKLMKKAFESCTLPLFVTLTFQEITRWNSYDKLPEDALMTTITSSIHKLFERLEKKHGQLFVSRALGYITATRNGLSETELEDILSLDDEVLNSVFVFWMPPIRRIPPSLWSRLRADIDLFLVERDSDGIAVLGWYHQQFVNVATEKYLSHHLTNIKMHHLIEEYYNGTWESIPKSFTYLPAIMKRLNIKDENSTAVRNVPKQPLIFNEDSDGPPRYNLRKMNELPYSLFHGRQLLQLKVTCLCNYSWIYLKLKATSLQDVLSDYALLDDKETNLVADALRMTGTVLNGCPMVLGLELTGRLLPHVHKFQFIRELVRQCDQQAATHCPLVPNCQIYSAPGGPLQYECEIDVKSSSPIDVDLFQSPGGILMTAKAFYNRTAQIWELTQGDPRENIQLPIGHIYPSADGRFLCMFKNNRFVLVYNSDSGELHGEIDYDYGIPRNISITKNILTFISETGVGPYVVDINNCVLIHKFTHNVTACAVSPDESFIAISGQNGLMLFEIPLMERRCLITTREQAKQITFTNHPFNSFLLSQNNIFKSVKFDLMSKGAKLNEILSDYDIIDFKLSHMEAYILVRAARCLYLVDAKLQKLKHRLQRMPAGVFVETMSTFSAAGFTPDDNMVVASRYTYIAVWETKSGAPLRLLPASVSPIVKVFTSDVLNKAVSLLKNNTLQVWNLDNLDADVQHANEIVKCKVTNIAVTSGGNQVACVGNKPPEITVASLATGLKTHSMSYSDDRDDEIFNIEMSPMGRFCVAKGKKVEHSSVLINWKQLSYDIVYNMRSTEIFHESPNNRFVVFDRMCYYMASVQCHLFNNKDWIRNSYKVYIFRLSAFSSPKENKTLAIPDNTEFVCKPVIYKSDQLTSFVAIYQTCTVVRDDVTKVELGRSFYTRLSLLNLTSKDSPERIVTVKSLLKHADEKDKFVDVKVHVNNLVLIYVKNVDYYEFDSENGLTCPSGVSKGAILYDPNSDYMLRHIPFILDQGTDVSRCLFSKNGSIIVNENLHVFEKKTNGFVKSINRDVIKDTVRLALDGQYIIALEKGGKTVVVLRTTDEKVVGKLFVHGTGSCLEVAEDDRTIVVGCTDGRVLILTLIIDCDNPVKNIINMLPSRKDLPAADVTPLDRDVKILSSSRSKEMIDTKLASKGAASKFKALYNAVTISQKASKARSQACSIQ